MSAQPPSILRRGLMVPSHRLEQGQSCPVDHLQDWSPPLLPCLLMWKLQAAQQSVVRSQEHLQVPVDLVKAVSLRVGQDWP